MPLPTAQVLLLICLQETFDVSSSANEGNIMFDNMNRLLENDKGSWRGWLYIFASLITGILELM